MLLFDMLNSNLICCISAPKENVRPVRKIELDKPRGSRLLHHSKLGSSPPFTTPSKLLFMEPKYQR